MHTFFNLKVSLTMMDNGADIIAIAIAFIPNVHTAMLLLADDQKEGTLVVVCKRGYPCVLTRGIECSSALASIQFPI